MVIKGRSVTGGFLFEPRPDWFAASSVAQSKNRRPSSTASHHQTAHSTNPADRLPLQTPPHKFLPPHQSQRKQSVALPSRSAERSPVCDPFASFQRSVSSC